MARACACPAGMASDGSDASVIHAEYTGSYEPWNVVQCNADLLTEVAVPAVTFGGYHPAYDTDSNMSNA